MAILPDNPKPNPSLRYSDMPPTPSASQFSGNEPSRTQETVFRDFQVPVSATSAGGRGRLQGGGDDGGIDEVWEKLIVDFQAVTDRISGAILRERFGKAPAPDVALEAATVEVERSWNLRERRKRAKVDGGWSRDSSPERTEAPVGGKRCRKPEFSVSLSRREIEKDFVAMMGHRLPRRPMKRPKAVQKELDCLFPGLSLSQITPDLYKVDDNSET